MSHQKKALAETLVKDAVIVTAAQAGRCHCPGGHRTGCHGHRGRGLSGHAHGHAHNHRGHHHHGHKLLTLLSLATLAIAIREELKKPAHARTWHGYLGGVVPYDFRVPTPEKVVDRVWNPDGPLLSPATFGVGWDPNVGRIVEEIKTLPLRDDPHFDSV